MRRLLIAGLLAAWLSTNSGCFLPIYSADPKRRTEQLIFTSVDLQRFVEEWERIWFLDQPSHMAPHRVHGGIL